MNQGQKTPTFSDELKALEHQISQEELAIQKLKTYQHQVQDADLKKIIGSMKEKHQEHYSTLMRHFKARSMQ
ncbi:MAG: spore coat protein [Firmicutes bacterium]|nr:spore coat protein [Bacillota bacterium]